jgi:tetratricopeptide (TPR) repeat protein
VRRVGNPTLSLELYYSQTCSSAIACSSPAKITRRARESLGRLPTETGTTDFKDAATAFRAALCEYTRERAPFYWAITQNNLGTALLRLGERKPGTAQLEQAVDAFRAALEEFTRERAPLHWAMAQNNLGTALRQLGERESGTSYLEAAVAAYRAALEERTPERTPLQWAMTNHNLGNALSKIGERDSGTGHLKLSVNAYKAALSVEPHFSKQTQAALAHVETLLASRQAASLR